MAEAENDFQASESFQGARPGYAFKMGPKGLGYYLDAKQGTKSFWAEAIAQLPETWREAPFREALLRVHAEKSCGVGMAHSAFGLVVETVDEVPGQDLQPGEVIVSIEGRVLASLSAPQMQASFQKRRLDGAKLLVGNHTQVKELSQRDPNIIQMWDPLKKHNYFFHKKSGRSAWTLEELQSKEGGAAASAPEAAKSSQAAPIDLSHFLQHGFAKQREPPPKKRPKAKASSQKEEEDGKDESDLARDERKRWRNWNEGGRGGYTEQFFERYKNVRMEEPKKEKYDKRMKGSVGPGPGMEYMARWTGSKNSFN